MKRLLILISVLSVCVVYLHAETFMINSFNGGKLGTDVTGRFDMAAYHNGCKTIDNCVVTPQGPLVKRPGLVYVAGTEDTIRVVPFDVENEYITEVHNITNAEYDSMTAGLFAHYTLDDNDVTSTVIDSVGDYNGVFTDSTGEINTNTVAVAGNIGGSHQFIGANERRIVIPDANIFTPASAPFSITAWINMIDATKFSIAGKGVLYTNGEWTFGTTASDTLTFDLQDESTNAKIWANSSSTLTSYQGQWIHVAATYDGSSSVDGIHLYINGQLITNTTGHQFTFTAVENGNASVFIGRNDSATGGSTYANGLIDDVKFFSVELTPNMIEMLYNNVSTSPIISTTTTTTDIDSYILGFGNKYIEVMYDTQEGPRVVYDGESVYKIETPYDGNDVADIQYIQSGDELYLFHSDYKPKILTHYAMSSWTMEDFETERGPLLPQNDTSITMSMSGSTTNVPFDLEQYYGSEDFAATVYSTLACGQTFTTSGGAYQITGAKLKAYREDSICNIRVSLYSCDANGFPTGSSLTSGTNYLPTQYSWQTLEFDFSPAVDLDADTKYALVITSEALYSYPANKFYIRGDQTTPTYTGGSMMYNIGAWTEYSGYDLIFETLGDPNVVQANDYAVLTSSADVFSEDYVGSIMEIVHTAEANTVSGSFGTTGSSSNLLIQLDRPFSLTTSGTWQGTVLLERSYDGGTTWVPLEKFVNASGQNINYGARETIDDAYYRATMSLYTSGTCVYNLKEDAFDVKGIVKITSFISATEVNCVVVKELGGISATTRWSFGAWSTQYGWPSTAAFYDGRLAVAGVRTSSDIIWFSATDYWTNFYEGTDDTSSFKVTLVSDKVENIKWLKAQSKLLVGTESSEWTVSSSSQEESITPTNRNAKRNTTNGSASIMPINVDTTTLYVNKSRKKVRGLKYSWEENAWPSPDLTVLSSDITSSGIVDWCFQTNPYPIAWCVLSDGNVAGLTFDQYNNTVGWHEHNTDGNFKSVSSARGSSEDRVWFVVERTIDGNTVTAVEQLSKFDLSADQTNIFYVDCGLSFDYGDALAINDITQSFPITISTEWHSLVAGDKVRILTDSSGMVELDKHVYTVGTVISSSRFELRDIDNIVDINSVDFTAYTSGGYVVPVSNVFSVPQLNGETVSVVGDGGYYGSCVVVDSNATIGDYFNKVSLGLPYTARVETLPLSSTSDPIGFFGENKRVSKAIVRTYNTLAYDIGSSWTDYYSEVFREVSDPLEYATPMYTGNKLMYLNFDYDSDSSIFIQSRLPLPFNLLAIKAELSVSK